MPKPSDPSGSPPPGEAARGTALAFQRGKPDAVDRVRRRVRRILAFRGLGLDPNDLPDLEQQVMTELWRAATRSDFDPAAGFWGFVETVTARRCIDARRRVRQMTELPETLEDAGESPLEAALADERARRADQVLRRLAPSCRELLELHAGQGLSYREIAPILGKSEGALRVQMHRCVEKARRILAASGPRPVEAADEKERP